MKFENIDKAVKLRDELQNVDRLLEEMRDLKGIKSVDIWSKKKRYDDGDDAPDVTVETAWLPSGFMLEVRQVTNKYLLEQKKLILAAIEAL